MGFTILRASLPRTQDEEVSVMPRLRRHAGREITLPMTS